MGIGSIDFRTLLRAHVYVQGLILTEDDLSKLGSCYLGYGGAGRWEVREYVRVSGGGPREYRVVRGISIRDVYRCAERGRANIVATALNELETESEGAQPPDEGLLRAVPPHTSRARGRAVGVDALPHDAPLLCQRQVDDLISGDLG
jgi:hypothetical protein